MLVRISSAASGIKEYLETGRKKGREFDRELIDDRMVIAGDLAITNAVIDSIKTTQPGAARYLHITLGFSERFTEASLCGPGEINLDKMRAVADEYRAMLMVAYDPNEYSWYAEAHVPKVTHDLHAASGQAVERLPHIHIVLPMRNLVDGRHLDPAGFSQHNIKYEQAMQEVLNARFALRSPLDAKRSEPIAPLAKHNADFEAPSPKQIRAELARLVADKTVSSFDQLIDAAQAFGAVRVRQGRDGDYINVQPTWAKKGINLKDFTRESFVDPNFAGAKFKSPDRADFDALLASWSERVAFESRFVNSANRKQYRALDQEGRTAWLSARIQKSVAKVRAEVGLGPEDQIQFKDFHERSRAETDRLVAVATLQPNLAADRRSGPPGSLASVRDLSSLPMAQHAAAFELLLQPDASDSVGREGGADHAVRREGGGNRGNAGGDGAGDDAITYLSTLRAARGAKGISPDQLKNDTSPTLVLEAAARQFGFDRNLYDITSARDGTPRIRHEDKHYNLGDFFTKHLGVPWAEAKVILERCYNETLADALPPPDKHLWRSFGVWRNERFTDSTKGRQQARIDLSEAILDARTTYKAIRIKGRGIPPAKRQVLMATARADMLLRIEAARERARQAKLQFAVPGRNAMYRAFLTELANTGNLNALGELRRMAKPEADMDQTVTGRTSRPVFPQPSYRVDYTGKVTYFQDSKAVVTDSLKGVSVIETTRNSHALALKVAVARYGPNLTFNGDALFMKNMLEAARASGMNLTIRDGSHPSAPPIRVGQEINR